MTPLLHSKEHLHVESLRIKWSPLPLPFLFSLAPPAPSPGCAVPWLGGKYRASLSRSALSVRPKDTVVSLLITRARVQASSNLGTPDTAHA